LHKTIVELVNSGKIEWKKHAIKRLLERGIKRSQVFEALADCEIIEQHDLKRPLPSVLVLGSFNNQPLHVMLAIDEKERVLWIITVYKPSLLEWMDDFKTRRQK
jgi:hypothetical protein